MYTSGLTAATPGTLIISGTGLSLKKKVDGCPVRIAACSVAGEFAGTTIRSAPIRDIPTLRLLVVPLIKKPAESMQAATKAKHSIVAMFLKGLLLIFLDKSFKKLIEAVAMGLLACSLNQCLTS